MSIEKGGAIAATCQQLPDESDRRRILSAAALVAAGGLLWKPQPAEAQGRRGRGSRLTVDVACLGQTFAPNFEGALNPPGELRGLSFYVEGALYPAGTILPGGGFDPDSVESTGHWLCRGWFMNYPERPAPGAITTQEYLLETITDSNPSPVETLVSSGLEGGASSFTRAIIGGSGRYRRAQGQVVQETIGTNTTELNVFEVPAPNFRFHFDFAKGSDGD